MGDWDCTLCGKKVPASEIITMNHFRLMHPEVEISAFEQWPDGNVVQYQDADFVEDIIWDFRELG